MGLYVGQCRAKATPWCGYIAALVIPTNTQSHCNEHHLQKDDRQAIHAGVKARCRSLSPQHFCLPSGLPNYTVMGPRQNRLSCDRCHTQKLRCPRQDSNDHKGCYRCVGQGVQCVYSRPLPKGRPRTNAIATARASTPHPTQAGATGTNPACSMSSSLNDPSTSPSFNRVPFGEDAETTITTSESTNPVMNSSTFLQSQLEHQKWSGALAPLRLEGDIFAPPQPQVNLQDPLRYIGSDEGDKSDLLPTGYMRLGNSSRPRYVESAFWALVHGQVS